MAGSRVRQVDYVVIASEAGPREFSGCMPGLPSMGPNSADTFAQFWPMSGHHWLRCGRNRPDASRNWAGIGQNGATWPDAPPHASLDVVFVGHARHWGDRLTRGVLWGPWESATSVEHGVFGVFSTVARSALEEEFPCGAMQRRRGPRPSAGRCMIGEAQELIPPKHRRHARYQVRDRVAKV